MRSACRVSPRPARSGSGRLNGDVIADFLVGGRASALILSRGTWPDYQVEPIALAEVNQARVLACGR